jgi:hypothetical protein
MTATIDISTTIHSRLLSGIDFSKSGYSVLARHGQPLLLIPAGKLAARQTLELYQPQSRIARFAMAGLKTACIATGVSKFLPKLGMEYRLGNEIQRGMPFDQTDIDEGRVGFLLCNPKHECARVIAIRTGDAPRIIKWADATGAKVVAQEAASIQRLAERKLAGVPVVFEDGGGTDGSRWFEMERLDASRIKSVADFRAVGLLSAWMGEERENPAETDLLKSIWNAGEGSVRWKAPKSMSALRVRKAVMHGDFAPWNLREKRGAASAIDWEWAREDGLAGVDLCYGLLQEALLVHRLAPRRALQAVLLAATRTPAARAYLEQAGWADDLKAWLELGVAYQQSKMSWPCPELLEALKNL